MTIQLSQPYSFCQLGQRDYQEDCRYPIGNSPQHFLPFFIVCDGVGGCEDGDMASKAVCKGLASYLEHFDWADVFTTGHLSKALGAAYDALDDAARHGSSDMGTTMTMVCFHQAGCTMAHIGDSRIYQIRPKTGIIYRSDDHSTISLLVHTGLVSPEQASTHHTRNVIERCMSPADGGDERCEATCYHTRNVRAGDYFFLCTDGVLETVSDQALVSIICGGGSDADKCKRIAQLSSHSQDNNTAYLIRVASVEYDNEADIIEAEAVGDTLGDATRRSVAKQPVTEEVGAESNGFGDKLIRVIKQLF